ncbi:MAG: hypothetical protein BWY99_02930 [Synergistetes bacterium ADurb.BinA166]|nr:MAG: hypothetical protein BWY99_02930 [Synergistetes bacterium ADurb.BinA166]
MIPPLLKDLIDRHRELALASPAEMIGLFKYVMYLLCYYGDKEERRD